MNKTINNALTALLMLGLALTNQSCMEEVEPTDYASGSQIALSENAQSGLLSGLVSFMVTYDTYGVTGGSCDWGYPCQMLIRDLMTEDLPVTFTGANYDYYSWIEEGTDLQYFTPYAYFYYTKLIYNANAIIASCDNGTDINASAGIGYAFRALAYLDLARMFEFRPTGYATLDAKAEADKVWGLTVPLVSDKTSQEAAKSNPRAPFYTMYRFINSDLEQASKHLADYSRSDDSYPDSSVVAGLKARFWLELGSRFENVPADLATQLEHEGDNDGYAALGIGTANDCYAKAATYAKQVIDAQFTPMTQKQWYDSITGFNTSNQAWVWAARIGSKEQLNSYWYYTWMGTMNSECSYSLSQYGTYRCISKGLFDQIGDKDWRKHTWIAPDDVGKSAKPAGYSTLLPDSRWSDLPAYTNLKYHAGNGNLSEWEKCSLGDIPLMRVEEMYLIYAEAIAHTQGVGAGKAFLENFVNTYRYQDGSYICQGSDMDSFIEELMLQKRIELWGEGLVYFDYKRLKLSIDRAYEGTNFYKGARLKSDEDCLAPWLNYYLPEYENAYNPACVLNPDPSGVVADITTFD